MSRCGLELVMVKSTSMVRLESVCRHILLIPHLLLAQMLHFDNSILFIRRSQLYIYIYIYDTEQFNACVFIDMQQRRWFRNAGSKRGHSYIRNRKQIPNRQLWLSIRWITSYSWSWKHHINGNLARGLINVTEALSSGIHLYLYKDYETFQDMKMSHSVESANLTT